jgi:uncharacterized delta-60 repeat protein
LGLGLARYTSDGTLDSAFGSNGIILTSTAGSTVAYEIALQTDGKIVAVGGGSEIVLVRYLGNGTLDTTFDGDGIVITAVGPLQERAHSLVLQPDGRIVVAGYHKTGGGDDFVLARYLPNGALDPSFGNGGIVATHVADVDDAAYAIVAQGDGKIIAVGDQNGFGEGDIVIVRHQPDGSLDTSYGNDGIVVTHIDNESTAYAAALQTDGKLVVGGQLTAPGKPATFIILRYHSGGCPFPWF